MSAAIMLAITMTVPPTRGALLASSQFTSGFTVYEITMPSKSGMTKLCAHDKANTVASVARIPSAKPRASTCIRSAGKVTSDAPTVGSSCSTARAESAMPVEAETAVAFTARTSTATLPGTFLRTRSTYAHFQFVDCLSMPRRSHSAYEPNNEKNDQNGSKNAATDVHVILREFRRLYE